jgi:hypothetical protein
VAVATGVPSRLNVVTAMYFSSASAIGQA